MCRESFKTCAAKILLCELVKDHLFHISRTNSDQTLSNESIRLKVIRHFANFSAVNFFLSLCEKTIFLCFLIHATTISALEIIVNMPKIFFFVVSTSFFKF